MELLRAAAAATPAFQRQPEPEVRDAPSAAPPAPPVAQGAPPAPRKAPAAPVAAPTVAFLEVGRLDVTRFSCSAFDGAEPQALGLTYWFEPPEHGSAEPLTVSFAGRRVGAEDGRKTANTFTARTKVDVVPGSGRTAVTARVRGIDAGDWEVTAVPVLADGRTGAAVTTRGTTAFEPVVRVSAPGARLGAWPALVGLGTVLALVTQALLAAQRGLPSLRVLLLTVLACVVGVAGAKAYYLATHRGGSTGLLTSGMSVQGFVLAALGTLAIGALASGLPVGEVLDVTTPGLLYGMTVGRFGCLFGGCCAGRPTSSRWGLWSSDRRVGTRRIPVQLLESAVAAVLGTVALVLVVAVGPPGGTVLVGTVAAYTFARQLLFPLRSVPRDTTYGRAVMMVLTALVLLADVLVAASA